MDSLRGAVDALTQWDNVQEGGDHHLKDAIFRLNHGLEVLFKYLLRSKAEYLIFTDLEAFMRAKKKVKDGIAADIFEANSNLKTVTASEARERLEILFDIIFEKSFIEDYVFISKKRNQIEHFGIIINDHEKEVLVEMLNRCLDNAVIFFNNHIEGSNEMMEKARYEYTISQAEADYLDHQYDVWSERRL